MRKNTVANLSDALTGLICIGLMIFTGGLTGVFFFLIAVFFLIAWAEREEE